MLSSLVLLIVGFFGGIASGMLGIGGGLIFVPTLYFMLPFFGVEQNFLTHVTIATSSLAGSFAATSSFINHLRVRNIEFRKGLLIASGSVVSGLIFPEIFVGFEPYFAKLILGIILLASSVKLLLENEKTGNGHIKLNDYTLIGFGLLIGVLSSMTGLGGGVVVVPLLFYLFSVSFKKSVGTSTLPVALTMLSVAVSYSLINPTEFAGNYQLGYINLLAGSALGLGSVFGTKFGVKIVISASTAKIKKIFAIFIIAMVIKILMD